jgi:hypothetical protein
LARSLLNAANARGVAVYLQVMAASPPGYRVQFSNALADDACLGPDGKPHGQRVDRNASLASSHVVAYITTLLTELASRYPGVAGFRLDWPEYPPYDFRSALFDFNPAALAQVAQAGHDPAAAREVTAWAQQLTRSGGSECQSRLARDADALLAAGWGSLTGTDGLAATLRCQARRLIVVTGRVPRSAGHRARGATAPRAADFPPPAASHFRLPIDALDGVADAVG